MTLSDGSRSVIADRNRAEACLSNAHQQLGQAFARMTSPPYTRKRDHETIADLVGAVDWLRRALEAIAVEEARDAQQ